MSVVAVPATEVLRRLDDFDSIIDVRSPAEYAADHLPGAENWPVLDDDERRDIGTAYKQVSDFEAKKRGAALVAQHIAEHLCERVGSRPRDWRPLVYCWRGGKRSGTLAWFLDQIGFRTHVVEGGYKAWRAALLADLDSLPQRFDFRVLCGRTGSGKTRLLKALASSGAQALDLEALARHRGSVLGALPDTVQPSQKAFDSAVWCALARFDPAEPVFVESESKKVGDLRVPESLIETMRTRGRCIVVELPDEQRVQLLLEDYRHLTTDVTRFCELLEALVDLRGRDVVQTWQTQARAGRFAEAFLDLMHRHYDPIYLRSMRRNFLDFDSAVRVTLADATQATLQATAIALRERCRCAAQPESRR
jgi:tRNA 2-selenouridine synthase